MLPHPSLPDGEDVGIPDLTPPDVDIPQVLESRIIQTGGHTLSQEAADILNQTYGLNLRRREWGRALEAFKYNIYEKKGAPKHGAIDDEANFYENPTDETPVGNFRDYVQNRGSGKIARSTYSF